MMATQKVQKNASGGSTVGKKSTQKQYPVGKGSTTKSTAIPKGTADKWKTKTK